MRGLVINPHCPDWPMDVERNQLPIFYLSTGEPVFEVWFWHATLKRWFVMSTTRDLNMESQGVVYFHPRESPDGLRERVHALEEQAGLRPRG